MIKFCLAGAMTLLVSASVFASDVIVDTGLSGGSTISVYNNGPSDFQTVAAQFDLTARYTLSDVEGSFSIYDTSTLNISIHSDALDAPGQELMSGTLTHAKTTSTYTDTWVGLHDVSLTLDPGTYWIVFSGVSGQPASAGMGVYDAARPLSDYRVMSMLNGTPPKWLSLDSREALGVRIQGEVAPVPEASALSMMLIGVAVIALRMGRARKDARRL